MLDPYPVFPVFAFLGFVVALIPLPWHLQSWNAGTCIYMLWASLASLIQFVGAIVWRNEAVEIAPVWCDIATKFVIGAGVGIPAASLCINRRLYNIASIQAVTVSRRDRVRAVIIDVCIGIGIPVLVMILHYIVQGHRFDVLQEVGCIPVIYNTLPAYFLVFMWPVVLGSVSFVYAGLTLRAFWLRRAQLSEFLSSTTSMNVSRYFRLMLLASIEMMCTIPLGIYSIYINTYGVELAPWISLADTHFDFSHVELIPAFIWKSEPAYYMSVEMGRWIYPVSCFLFFALFGFAEESRRNYRMAFWSVAKRLGFQPPVSNASMGSSFPYKQPPKITTLTSIGTLPVYFPRTRPDSLAPSFAETVNEKTYETEPISPASSATMHDEDATFAASTDSYLQSPIGRQILGATVDTDYTINDHPHIFVSDAHPAPSRPSSPIASLEPVALPPYFHRPFSPPSVYPVSSPQRFNSVRMTVHTQTHDMV